jgi:hypothetical protein
MSDYNDFPIEELASGMADEIRQGHECRFKWTCDACGERATAGRPNVVYSEAAHDDCPVSPGYVTNTKAKGGNYLVLKYSQEIPIDGDTQTHWN